MSAAGVMDPISVGFHVGNVITLLADQYGTGSSVIREGVQNAIDEGAKNIAVVVDCVQRTINTFDDGDGAGPDEIRRKFVKIGQSLKDRATGAIGEKGIGNLAGLAVADRWQLVTRDTHVKGDPLRVFTFQRTELEKAADVQVDVQELSGSAVNGAPFKATTVLKLTGVDEITLKQIGDRETIERTLREAFSLQLRARKITLQVSYRPFKGPAAEFRIKPTQYRGTPLETVEVDTEYGFVTFSFFYSAHPVDKPTIVVQHQGANALALSNFFMLRILPKEIESLFTRGYFEGEIGLGFCEQNADRTAFRASHQLQVFAKSVVGFAEDVLAPMIQQFEDEDRSNRLRRITERALRKMRSFLSRHHVNLPANLKAAVIRMKKDDGAEAGTGTTATAAATKPGAMPGASVKVAETPGGARPPLKKAVEQPSPRVLAPNALKEQKEKSKRMREAQASGQKIEPVKKPQVELTDGLAIQLVHPDPDEPFNWRSRTTSEGVIQVNVVSNEFLEAERRGASELERFELLLLQKELTCASLPPLEARNFDRGFEGTFLHLWRSSLQG
jgi:hypothetical protein